MRRTEQEYKAEILRRSDAYGKERTIKRKKIAGISLCVCISVMAFAAFEPFGSSSKAPMAVMDEMKVESAIVPQFSFSTESNAAEVVPMEPGVGMDAISESPAEVQLVTVIFGAEMVVLNDEDSAIIADYIFADGWIMAAANCLCDYKIQIDGLMYRYHSDCGTIQDEKGRSLKLSDFDKEIFNEILGRPKNPI